MGVVGRLISSSSAYLEGSGVFLNNSIGAVGITNVGIGIVASQKSSAEPSWRTLENSVKRSLF